MRPQPARTTTWALALSALALPTQAAQAPQPAGRIGWSTPCADRDGADGAPDVPAAELSCDWNGDGLPDLLRLDEEGRLELRLAGPDGLGEAIPLEWLVPDAVRFGVVPRDGGAALDVVVLDRDGRAHVGRRSVDGGLRPALEPQADPTRTRGPAGSPPRPAAPQLGAGAGAPPPGGPGGPPPAIPATLRDRAGGPDLQASSTPTLGLLHPLGPELFVDPAGPVGVGTVSPAGALTVEGGDALVEGRFSIGLPGQEELLVRESSVGPTVELRDASLATTVTLGESSLVAGLDAGLELVDLASGLPLVTAGSPDGIDLSDAWTGALGLRLTSEDLFARNLDQTVTARLSSAPGAPRLQLFDANAVETVALDTDPDFGGARLRLRSSGGDDLQLGRRVLGGSNAEARLAVGKGVELSTSRSGGVADTGSLVVRDLEAHDTIVLDGRSPTGGPEVRLNDGSTDRVRIAGQGNFGAPTIEILEEGIEAAQIDAESAGNSGELTFRRFPGGDDLATLRGDAGGGGALSVFSTDSPGSVELVRLDPELGEIVLRDDAGTTRLRFQGTALTLFDAGGNPTIAYDGQTTMKNGVVTTRDFGARRLYAIESPEVWFEDAGDGRLAAGRARVDLDPVFRETVTVSADEPLVVSVTPTGPCRGLWVEADERGFTVRERGDGRSDATFDWHVLARRRGFEDVRMEPLRVANSRVTSEGEDS